jgi:hypothetical protein
MPKILFKKEKKVKLDDLRESEISPKRDWRWVLCIFFGWIIFCILSIGFVFFVAMKGDISGPADPLTQEEITISKTRLLKAVEFIESRSASIN